MISEITTSQSFASSSPSENISVILVEDNSFLRQSLADYLRQRNMIVTEAVSGTDFHSCFDPKHQDIAILDVNLPDTSGFQLAALIRERSNMGIIILTARTKREDRLRGYREGADIYLTKPVDSEELALVISNLTRRSRQTGAQSAGLLEDGDRSSTVTLMLDRKTQNLRMPDGTNLKLSTREAAFLEYMAARPNVIVSRAEVAAIFGEDKFSVGSRITDVALARLRARIRRAGSELSLQVMRNTGYKLITDLHVV